MVDYKVFILSYGRANNVITYKTLRNSGYTGDIYIICSSDDKELDEYKKRFENIIIFNKEDYKNKFDIGDNFKQDNVVVFARNAIYDLAKSIGVEYFIMLDDDYTSFNYRFDNKLKYIGGKNIKNSLDDIFNLIFEYYISIPALSIAWAQGGDFIGGKESELAKIIKIKRKIMNIFFCSTNRPIEFIGRINEDVNTYVKLGHLGKLVFQTNQLGLEQKSTQTNQGGLTSFYLDTGTYIKSFYTILFSPSSVKINLMGNKFRRLHHKINWNNTAVKIINEKYKLL